MGSAGIGMLEPHPVVVFVDWVYRMVKVLRKVSKRREISSIDLMGPEGHEVLTVRFEGRDDGLFFDVPQHLNLDSSQLLVQLDVMLDMVGYGKQKSKRDKPDGE
jgi:hypothetical protein